MRASKAASSAAAFDVRASYQFGRERMEEAFVHMSKQDKVLSEEYKGMDRKGQER